MASGARGKKEQTHERIVRVAAEALRARGYDGVTVGEVMEAAGLTHGGFYAHFPSREAMLAEALEQASAESLRALGRAEGLEALVDGYLSDQHLASPGAGCAVAAVGSETRRQAAGVRRVATRGVKELVDVVARQLPRWGKGRGHEEALAVVSCLVGAMVIARAVDDPALGRTVRRAARRSILERAGGG